MKNLLMLALLFVFLPKAHAATCTTLSSGASQSTISSALSSCGSGNTVAFSAGAYGPITSAVLIPCGVSMSGPNVAYSQSPNQTAVIDGSSSSPAFWGFQTTAGCSASQTIQYLQWNGEEPSNGGGFLDIVQGTTNLIVQNNWLYGVNAPGASGGTQHSQADLIYFNGSSSGSTTNNVSIQNNIFGSTSFGDCGTAMKDTSNTENGSGGQCGGVGIHNNVTNVSIINNIFHWLEEPIKTFESQGECNPVTVSYNSVSNYSRIGYETQCNAGTSSQPTLMYIQYNNFGTRYNNLQTYDISAANGCGNTVASNCITHTDYNVDLQAATGASDVGLEIWGETASGGSPATTANYNLIQGYIYNGITWSQSGQFTFNNNTFNLVNNGTNTNCDTGSGGFWEKNTQYSPAYSPSCTGNTFSNAITGTYSSAQPTLSPASGSFSGSQLVTITNTGSNRDTNTTVWCTTDGTTPAPGSGTAIGYYNGGSIRVSATTTIKCVGMWGDLNQPYSYPSGYGYVPSAVVSATYTLSGGGMESALGNGTYEIESGSDSVDGGFGYYGYSGPQVQLYSTVSPPATLQEWIWNGSTFQNDGWSGHYMTDAGNGTVSEPTSGYDTWTVTQSGSGWIIQDNRTGNYLSNNGGTLAMSTTRTVWTLPGAVVNLALGTYEFTISGDSIDGGFGYYGYSGPQVQLYGTVSPSATLQEWIWNGSTLQNDGWPGHYMTDAGGTVSEPTSGYDTWTVVQSGSGVTLKNNRTGKYLTDSGGSLITSSTATVFADAAQ